jgi:hypothetical protein
MSHSSVETACPPTPKRVPEAATAAAATHGDAEVMERELGASPEDGMRYRKLAVAYAAQLAEVERTEQWLEATMDAFGRYLCQQKIRPEHIVICVREALKAAKMRQYASQRRLAERAIGWAIAGYYAETGGA